MKKVLIFTTLESVPWGGSEVLWHTMAKRMLQMGWQVMTVTLEWPDTPAPISELKNAGAQTVFRPNLHIGGGIADAAANKVKALAWKTKVLEFQPDILLVSQGGAFDHALYMHAEWLQSLNVPMYIMAQYMNDYEYMHHERRKFFRKFLPAAEKVFFVSRRNKEAVEKILAQPVNNAVVIKNPIKLRQTTQSYPDTGTYKFGVVARLDAFVKGYDLLAEVFSRPQWQERNCVVNVYGGGLDEEYIGDMFRFFKVEDKVILRGHMNDIVSVWEENHILLLTSRGEGTPLSLLEAAYCKRPAVVTDVGGNTEVVTDGVNGFVAKAPVVSCLEETLERAWAQRDNWQAMGLEARKKVDELYNTDVVEDTIQHLM